MTPTQLLGPVPLRPSPGAAAPVRPGPPGPQRPSPADAAALRLQKKRLADRLYQRRHRAKREQLTRELEAAVRALRDQIAHLRARRQAAAAARWAAASPSPSAAPQLVLGPPPRAQLHAHARAVVDQYLRVFAAPRAPFGPQTQFLRLVLAPQALGADVRGADGFVRQLRLYARYCVAFSLRPSAASRPRVRAAGDLAVVDADVDLRLRFCPWRVADLFPRLRSLPRPLAERLAAPLVGGWHDERGVGCGCGQAAAADGFADGFADGLAARGSLTFVFDRAGLVTSLLADLQLLDALRMALGSLEDAALLADGARMALESGAILADDPAFAAAAGFAGRADFADHADAEPRYFYRS